MIEKFNFFDVYSYLLPGGLLMFLIWMPFGIISGKWPSSDLSGAAIGLGIAYMVGHVLRIFSDVIFSSKFLIQGRMLRPSYLLVDKQVFPVLETDLGGLKKVLEKQIADQFNLQINVDAEWSQELQGTRDTAFLLCRSFLVENKAASYLEQQQGMYELLRGMSAAMLLAVPFCAGLALSAWFPEQLHDACIYLMVIALIGALLSAFYVRSTPDLTKANKGRRLIFHLLSLSLLCLGIELGTRSVSIASPTLPIDPHMGILFFALAVAILAISILCGAAMRVFAISFAATVYRDFSAFLSNPPKKRPPGDDSGSEI